MTKLSVNVNKIATLRNSRGNNVPNLKKVVNDIINFGAQGITVHPRSDQRHVKYSDLYDIRPIIKTVEFNIEGYPSKEFIDIINDVRPEQVTLVPDKPNALTSNAGWDTIQYFDFLSEVIHKFRKNDIRTSIFIEVNNKELTKNAKLIGADRVELYTENYSKHFDINPSEAIEDYKNISIFAKEIGIGINAGHDLNLENLEFFAKNIIDLKEVSIGHALICESLYYGLEKTIEMYLNKLS